ncbi:peroxide stress protein YaaA [Jannaschia sp. S6380]|uniref:peroxide stress protein YaaA n=1 Tax=Jannaschia sp. S6380 TaxID=2926408 RepID=UPI001FF597AD|nr:peroxide stress protein YaaA [Jannaschia sp. S6380]MCK0168813.1 peroxide stress protein YaaA [Jannaschia sp. S6380]
MLTVISPAKSLDFDPVDVPPTAPRFADDTARLVRTARRKGIRDLQALMDISEKLARLNRDRFRDWEAAPEKPAIFAFAGDTYTGLDAATLSEDALRHAQGHLRILSGLYGLLRPLDALKPYRLEMGSKLATRRGRDLYAFWGDRIAKALEEDAAANGATCLVNCASQEYFGAVDREALTLPVVTPTFLEDRPDGPKIVSFFAKQARGAMARYVIENRIEGPSDLRAFDSGGYLWQADRSTPQAPVFLRPDRAAQAA